MSSYIKINKILEHSIKKFSLQSHKFRFLFQQAPLLRYIKINNKKNNKVSEWGKEKKKSCHIKMKPYLNICFKQFTTFNYSSIGVIAKG